MKSLQKDVFLIILIVNNLEYSAIAKTSV